MASDHAYQYSVVDMEEVANDIEEFIIPENQEACKLLWSKNIFTRMCNNYENDNSWITFSMLDEDNKRLFDELSLSNPCFGKTWGGIGLTVPVKPGKGVDAYSSFKPLIDMFAYQDVQKDGYMTKEEFLAFYCMCFKVVANPEYRVMKEPKADDYTDILEFLKDWDEYSSHTLVPKEIRVFDESKMEMSFEDYLSNSRFAKWYDPDNERIYYNQFYYDAHMKYKQISKVPNF